jgi:hypothetical protein
MRRPGHWAPAQNVRHFGGRVPGPTDLERTGRLLGAIRPERSGLARLPATGQPKRNERKRMDAGAPRDGSRSAPRPDENAGSPHANHPITRLEAEIERTERPGGVEPAETERLLEETWSLFTECLVIRDGLLEACDEIERTMGGLQHKLGALPVGIEPHPPANGTLAAGSGPRGALGASHNGTRPHSNGASANGHANGSSNGNANGSSTH